jgi:hypothetical protein
MNCGARCRSTPPLRVFRFWPLRGAPARRERLQAPSYEASAARASRVGRLVMAHKIESDLALLKWMAAANIVLTLVVPAFILRGTSHG